MTPAPARFAIRAQFLGVCLAGGSGFFFMTVALEGMTFVQIAWARTLLGAVGLLLFVGLTSGFAFPRRKAVWGHVAVLSVVNLLLPYLLLAWSQQRIPSSLAAVYNATTPLLAVVMAVAVFRIERLRGVQTLGLLVGLGGVLLILAPWASEGRAVDLWGTAACLIATTSFAFSFAYTRKFVSLEELPGSSLAVLVASVAAVVMLASTPWMDLGTIRPDTTVVASMIALGIVGSGMAVMWSLNVIQTWGPSRASASMYLAPVVGVFLGVTALAETIRWHELIGGAIVLAAIPLINAVRRGPVPVGSRIETDVSAAGAVPQASPVAAAIVGTTMSDHMGSTLEASATETTRGTKRAS